jgi:hypothetical protein
MRRTLLTLVILLTLQATAQTPQPVIPPIQQSITVTADRGLLNLNDSATSVAALPLQQLEDTPGLTLDDRLYSVAGFQLFRRTSVDSAAPRPAALLSLATRSHSPTPSAAGSTGTRFPR